MAFRNIRKYLTVVANSVYAKDAAGLVSAVPSAIDATVNLPAIGFGSTDVNQMGTFSVSDPSRVDNMQVTISCQTQAEALALAKATSWVAKFVYQVIDPATGVQSYEGFEAHFSGNVAGFGGGSVAVGETGDGDLTINAYAYRLLQGGTEIVNINRAAGIVSIGGDNLREKLNALL